ncbi:hypothetical protein D9M70_581370 [compost metagenome]
MFGLQLATDCQPRRKSGIPAHKTIGKDRANSIQVWVRDSNHCRLCPNMASTVTTTVSGSVHQNRR